MLVIPVRGLSAAPDSSRLTSSHRLRDGYPMNVCRAALGTMAVPSNRLEEKFGVSPACLRQQLERS